ncbi:cell wall metabolism sensor histidine kinase WalK [Sporosarcina sp. ACRSL]|uniref:two-component system histidine kinase PnpS n=1 Tax=Sporosarcina sp. ACRSL TaxID=2918215 RepID=UPI001EF4C4FF|nr:ATP-binding protein [Sporosarcina sp. ACRSL]MCG7346042.1 cell wall metabolism sensor histidine kinase WalK [Sporosarcina sp. ACRSL]
MKGLYSRLFIAFATILLVLLTGLGIVLGQFFYLIDHDVTWQVQRKYWIFLIAILSIAYVLSLLLGTRFIKQYASPTDLVTETAKKIARGDYLARTPVEELDEGNELGIAVNQIARNLQETSILRAMEKERMNTLIESMGNGLLMFGREGSVNLLNRMFEKTFGLTKDELVGKTFKEIGLPEGIQKLIEDVYLTEQVHERQLRIGELHFNVYGAPVIGRHGNWLGIIVVLHDITKLVKLEEIRKDFVANVSHELRTPITSIKGFTETLLDGAMNDPITSKEFLEIIQKESNRLHLLINDLLELSGIEREGFQLKYDNVSISDIIENAMKIVYGLIEKKHMNIVINTNQQLFVQADSARLIQVLVNLLTNAINYSKENTTITINTSETDDEAIIEVQDEGMGIAEKELPRLFERFYRVDRARSRDSGGTGLGLAIVKHLIEAHGGKVTVESTVGVGTKFTIMLPKKSA